GAVDAEASRGLGLQPGRRDGLAAALAPPVRARLDLAEGMLDLVEGLPQRCSQGLGLAPLRRHLAGVGEVGVVVQAAVVAEANLLQLMAEIVPLALQLGAAVDR